MNKNSYLYDADRNDVMRSVMTVEDAEFLHLEETTAAIEKAYQPDEDQANLDAYYEEHDCHAGPEDGCEACEEMMSKLEHAAHE